MDQLRRPEPVARTLSACSFGFFTAEEARKLSVKRVTATEILDRQGNAVPDGLYDPAMGPTDPKGACATCRLGYAHCPGHFGHIELPLPVYNPLTFGTVLRLLRAQCMHCGGFRLAHKRTETYRRKLRLLARGKLTEAMALPLLPRASKRAEREAAMELDGEAEAEPAAEEDEEEEQDAAEAAAAVAAACADGPTPAPPAWTSHSWGEARALMTDFLARQPTVCENCGCRSPALSAEAPVKIHRKPLPAKARGANMAAARADVEADLAMLWRGLMAEIGGADAAAAEAPAVDSEAEASSDEDEDDDEEGDGSEGAAPDDADAVEEEEEEGSESDKPRKKSGGKKKDGGAAARPASAYARPQRAGPGPKLILLTPLEARALLRKLWQAEPGWLALAYAADADVAARAAALPAHAPPPPLPDPGCLFMQTLLVPPNKLRPPSRLGEMTFEHPQNEQYKAVLVACTRLADHFRPRGEMDARAAAAAAVMDETPGAAAVRAVRTWLEMQNGVVRLLGAGGAGAAGGDGGTGIKQQLERKQGLFRMNMMGKRVNYAARSVISPDPFLAPGEIGVPPFVACKLTFPELVTPHNVEMLRAAVMNGPDAYPGATAVENEAGRVLQLAHLSAAKRAALAKTLLAAPSAAAAAGGGRGRAGAKAVYRHLIDGDVLLTNRQPTLHKPGVMAHRARVLAGQRTIRMHYANCATFNADFDGDEINLHLPQEHHGRAEAYGIVAADAQFCVPTDGKPIRGLIQDHVVAGVLLTMRGTFLTRDQFSALLYTASLSLPGGLPREVLAGGGASATKRRPALRVVSGGLSLQLPTPCLLKPTPLWSGKQLLTALLALLADGRPAVTTSAKGKVPDDYWGAASGEDTLVVHRGEVVKGVLDKNAFAKYGLVHSVAELYGSADAGRLLAALSRLLTGFLAEHGFTCGLDDLMLTARAEMERAEALAAADGVAAAAAEEFAFGGAPPRAPGAPPRTQEEVRKELVARLRERAGAEAGLDSKSTGPLNKIASATIKTCLPRGQVKPFPRNCLSLMTVSGAKGGPVNFAQISALLGQQELEGRRVPRMPSGKTLPCFSAWDLAARAGGFIGDRFLTGIRPQEYYFHCMAGREGLVDTAVKTSRSGYLQRCLVKNLEALRVSYDGTVRDCDGGVVQFAYGEDGLDVTRTAYARRFDFLAANGGAVAAAFAAWAPVAAAPTLVADAPGGFGPPGLPAQARWRATCTVGAVGEGYRAALDAYVAANPEGHLLPDAQRPGRAGKGSPGAAAAPPGALPSDAKGRVTKADFVRLMELRHMASSAAAGEAVGVLAAQSVGEPSTQMTLNTFHFAGRGEANVTLGIPRLRELLMAAAKRIGTPVMTLPTPGGEAQARAVAARLRRVSLAELLSSFTVAEKPFAGAARAYTVRAVVRHAGAGPLPRDGTVGFDEAADAFRAEFTRQLVAIVKTELRRAGAADAAAIQSMRAAAAAGGGGGGNGSDDEGGGAAEGAEGGAAAKKRARGREAAAEVGEAADGAEEEEAEEAADDEEGAKADARRGARAGEGYTQPDEADDAAARRRTAAPRDGDEAEADPEAPPSEDEAEEEEDAGSDSDSEPGAGASAATLSARAVKALLTTLEELREGVESDADASELRCTLRLKLGAPKLLLLALAQRAAAATAVRVTPGIRACYVLPPDDTAGAPWRVQTDGINFAAAQAESAVDARKLASNDVYAVLQQYGVEAARATLLAEVRAVFGAYGIGVDPRHLSLIADAMTHGGGYRPCSRAGLDSCPSPLLKMSFETATAFLTDATLRGATDDLHAPSSRIVLGRVVDLGTGACGLHFDLPRAQELHAQRLAAAV